MGGIKCVFFSLRGEIRSYYSFWSKMEQRRRLFIANVNGWQGFDLIILQLNCCRRAERREREYCAHLRFYDSFQWKTFRCLWRKELFIAIMELEKAAVFHWNQFEKTKWDRFPNKKLGPINKITLEPSKSRRS
jgi:hypothetical protein